MNPIKAALLGLVSLILAHHSFAAPTVGTTTVLGSFTGTGATLHADNVSPNLIQWYGTDLGFTYTHAGKIQFLFGDSWRDSTGLPIQSTTSGLYDDGFGSVDLSVYGTPSAFTPASRPLIKLGQNAGTVHAAAINPGVVLDIGKTPLGGFSNGSREFGVFTTTKPQGCLTNSDCTAISAGLTCDTGLGFWGAEYFTPEGFTGGCIDGQFGCLNDTMANIFGFPIPGTGFCRDTTSSVYAATPGGRLAAVAAMVRVGIRSTTDARSYTNNKQLLSNKFYNQTVATVQSFVPANGAGYLNQNYNVATGSGAQQRVLLWGRPGFIGIGSASRSLGLYFAYVNMPTGSSFTWTINYYTGTVGGIPQFSTNQQNAVALDLNSTTAGVQAAETHDVVNQASVMWVDHLHKWVMFYGGGMSNLPVFGFPTCGVLELFTGPDCTSVVLGNGAVRMRTADDPWGPWTPPQDVLVGGVPSATPLQGQYVAGGMLRHPSCVGATCAPHSPGVAYAANEYGFLYGANLVQSWITPVGASVDVIWNASSWDPYRVALFRTRINP